MTSDQNHTGILQVRGSVGQWNDMNNNMIMAQIQCRNIYGVSGLIMGRVPLVEGTSIVVFQNGTLYDVYIKRNGSVYGDYDVTFEGLESVSVGWTLYTPTTTSAATPTGTANPLGPYLTRLDAECLQPYSLACEAFNGAYIGLNAFYNPYINAWTKLNPTECANYFRGEANGDFNYYSMPTGAGNVTPTKHLGISYTGEVIIPKNTLYPDGGKGIIIRDASSSAGTRPTRGVYVWDDVAFGMELQNEGGAWNTTFITRASDGGFRWKRSDDTWVMAIASSGSVSTAGNLSCGATFSCTGDIYFSGSLNGPNFNIGSCASRIVFNDLAASTYAYNTTQWSITGLFAPSYYIIVNNGLKAIVNMTLGGYVTGGGTYSWIITLTNATTGSNIVVTKYAALTNNQLYGSLQIPYTFGLNGPCNISQISIKFSGYTDSASRTTMYYFILPYY